MHTDGNTVYVGKRDEEGMGLSDGGLGRPVNRFDASSSIAPGGSTLLLAIVAVVLVATAIVVPVVLLMPAEEEKAEPCKPHVWGSCDDDDPAVYADAPPAVDFWTDENAAPLGQIKAFDPGEGILRVVRKLFCSIKRR